MKQFEKKTVLIGICGGIAAYKAYELIRLYKKNGFEVKVVTTPAAMSFVTKLTLETLSDNEIYTDNEIKTHKPEHISLADEADIAVIAPITANTVSKIACGICDNLLTSIICAFNKPVIVAPAMNTNMWKNEVIQKNISTLKTRGCIVIPPETGSLACGVEGEGRLCDINKIYNKTVEVLNVSKILKGKKIVITAGGTVEKIDPVRYISNFSSGKMGTALADCAHNMGASVELISTFNIERPYPITKVQSADEVLKVLKEKFDFTDGIIMAAAVADYRPENYAVNKIKKNGQDKMTISLTPTPDILKIISNSSTKAVIVGFCAESENLIENAKTKIKNKGCDFIIANDISRDDIGFSSDYNEVSVIDKSLNVKHFEKDTKINIAKQILEYIFG